MTFQEYLEQLLHHIGVGDTQLEIEENDEYLFIDIQVPEEDAGKMIGNRGETIQAFRQLVFLSFTEEIGEKKVVVNVNDYKEKKEEQAIDMAIAAAERARDEGRPQHLPKYFLAHQRRAIHQELQDFPGVTTHSEGEGRDRHLVIYPDDAHQASSHEESSDEYTVPTEVLSPVAEAAVEPTTGAEEYKGTQTFETYQE